MSADDPRGSGYEIRVDCPGPSGGILSLSGLGIDGHRIGCKNRYDHRITIKLKCAGCICYDENVGYRQYISFFHHKSRWIPMPPPPEPLRLRSSFNLSDPSQWYDFLQHICCNMGGLCTGYLDGIHWLKEPKPPGHEYVVLRFRRDRNHSAWLRLERDTGSWMTILNRDRTAKNCRDKATIAEGPEGSIITREDIRIASLDMAVSFISPLHIILLLRQLREHVSIYNITTYNCWWFAGCIWENVAYWVRQGGDGAVFEVMTGNDTRGFADALEEPNGLWKFGRYDWSATTFSRNLQRTQLQVMSRALPTWASMFGEVERDTENVRQYCSEKLHEVAFQLAKKHNLLSVRAPETFGDLVQSEGHEDPALGKALARGLHPNLQQVTNDTKERLRSTSQLDTATVPTHVVLSPQALR